MPTKNRPALSWLDRLLIKLAVAKAGARGAAVTGLAEAMTAELVGISPSTDTSQSVVVEASR